MSAVEMFKNVRPIARWDLEPSEFWEAVTRIQAELRYNPRMRACRLPEPHGPVRRTVTGEILSAATKERLCQLVSQLSWLLPSLERLLATSRVQGLARISYYRSIFLDACNLINIEAFRIDERVDFETRLQQIDVLSRAMLLKSELLLVIAQFDLLCVRENGLVRSRIKLKSVA